MDLMNDMQYNNTQHLYNNIVYEAFDIPNLIQLSLQDGDIGRTSIIFSTFLMNIEIQKEKMTCSRKFGK